jgi:hypothetical protein
MPIANNITMTKPLKTQMTKMQMARPAQPRHNL